METIVMCFHCNLFPLLLITVVEEFIPVCLVFLCVADVSPHMLKPLLCINCVIYYCLELKYVC